MQQKLSESNNNCKNCQEIDIEVQQALPCILHKKHKVIKLIKNHLEHVNQAAIFGNINEEQETENASPTEPDDLTPTRRTVRAASRAESESGSGGGSGGGGVNAGRSGSGVANRNASLREGGGGGGGEDSNLGLQNQRAKKYCLCIFISLLLAALVILLIMVYVSAGPLSLSIPHTPINPNTFVRTDCLCSLEKKYLLRWSRPERFD